MSDRIKSLSLKRIVVKRPNGIILGVKSSFIISGAILFLTLIISVTRACIFLWWIETELFLLKMTYDRMLFITLVRGMILLLLALLWNIRLSKLGCYKCLHNYFFFLYTCTEQFLLLHFIFWSAFLQELFMWSSKESFESKTIARSALPMLALTMSFPDDFCH